MAIVKSAITAPKTNSNIKSFNEKSISFKQIMEKTKKIPNSNNFQNISIKKTINNAIDNHKKISALVEKTLTDNNFSLEKLLKLQYKTSMFFLGEQMFCKTIELSANSLKNFSQMQV